MSVMCAYSEKWLLLHLLCIFFTRTQSSLWVPPQQLLRTTHKRIGNYHLRL